MALLLLAALPSLAAGKEPSTDSKTESPASSYLAEIHHLMQVRWPKNRTVNIVAHGHSVPAGYFRTPVVDSFNAYPHLLHKGLKKRYPRAVINVIVTAIGGETADRGAKRFKKDVLDKNPDVVLIDYSLNDRRIGLPRAKAAWDEMILAAKAQGCKVILLTPTGDSRADLDNPSDKLNLHAEQVRQLAKEHQVPVVDSLVLFKEYAKGDGQIEDLLSASNHPNRKGHAMVAEEILKEFDKARD